MRFLILFIFLITNAVANELPEIENIVIHKNVKTYENLIFYFFRLKMLFHHTFLTLY